MTHFAKSIYSAMSTTLPKYTLSIVPHPCVHATGAHREHSVPLACPSMICSHSFLCGLRLRLQVSTVILSFDDAVGTSWGETSAAIDTAMLDGPLGGGGESFVPRCACG